MVSYCIATWCHATPTDAKNVSCSTEIEQLREKVYGTLEEYSRTKYPDEPGRFAKLLLRLPALRSIG